MVYLTMKRIYNARMTAVRAKNQSFKDYWNHVADRLEEKLRLEHG